MSNRRAKRKQDLDEVKLFEENDSKNKKDDANVGGGI